ncbi:MAG: glycosyltransferase family 2 protein [Patescibacteria group bacterium]
MESKKLIESKKISVVIPCYNEAENISELYERLSVVLKNITTQYEIIFVDNLSTDRSENIFRNLAEKDKNVSVLFFSRNFGHSQYGYSAGTEYATGDAVIWMEGDLQDPPEVIPRFVEKWLEGFDVVYGIRPRGAGSSISRFARRIFYYIFHKLSYLNVPRDVGDFSLLDRKVVDIFNAMPERSRFVRGLRAWIGFHHTGVEYKRAERTGGVTSNPSLRRNIWWAKKFIFSFSYAPLEFISLLTVWLCLFTFLLLIVSIFFALKSQISWFMVTGGVVLALFLLAPLIAIAILAEVVGIIFEEVKNRPKYIIEEILNNHHK